METATGQMLGTLALMVRIRKDTTTLTVDERNRFCTAMATFNNAGPGRLRDCATSTHRRATRRHTASPASCPGTRAFLLDLERELQQIDPRVALPYWQFDRLAVSLFSRDSMGVTTQPTNVLGQYQP